MGSVLRLAGSGLGLVIVVLAAAQIRSWTTTIVTSLIRRWML